MNRIHVVVEGATEEQFVQEILLPYFSGRLIYIEPIIIGSPNRPGGNVNYQRLRNDLQNKLNDSAAYCTTMFDLYGIRQADRFPGYEAFKNLSGAEKAVAMETAMKQDFDQNVRLIPYIQLHEFEALLFSNPSALASAIRQPHLAHQFQAIRNAAANPEEINEGIQTAPSKHIKRIYPGYDKIGDGIRAARAMGLPTLRAECPHFHAWIGRLESLPDLP